MDNYTQQPSLVILFICGFIGIVLQILLAPVITLFGVVPNFVMITVVIIAVNNGPVRSTIFGFIMGLLFDLCSLGPVGGMSFVLTIMGYGVSSINKGSFTSNMIVDIIVLFVAVALGEFLVSVVYAVVGVNQEFLLSLIQRVLPGLFYDAVLGSVLLLIYKAIIKEEPGGRNIMGGGSSSGRALSRKLNR